MVRADTNGVHDVFVYDRATQKTKRVSLRSNGAQANRGSGQPSISTDGRFVAFQSAATNLVRVDTNGYTDVFAYDRATLKTRRVSVSSNGAQGKWGGREPSISADGRFVAFESLSRLVRADTNGENDVFVHDRATHKTERVSVSSTGVQAKNMSGEPSISADGQFVSFFSFARQLVRDDTNGQPDVFVHDRTTQETQRVSVSSTGAQANGMSDIPSISGDGRFVAFQSSARNLVPADTNNAWDVFARGPLH